MSHVRGLTNLTPSKDKTHVQRYRDASNADDNQSSTGPMLVTTLALLEPTIQNQPATRLIVARSPSCYARAGAKTPDSTNCDNSPIHKFLSPPSSTNHSQSDSNGLTDDCHLLLRESVG